MSIIAVSGGFDPIHAGHIKLIMEAGKVGQVVVILNSDAWLIRKKNYVFMPWEERKEIILALKPVIEVVPVDDADGTVCKALEILKPTYFGNGGDRTNRNTPEKELCERLGIKMIWELGGGKIQSSSALVSRCFK